MKSKPLSSSNSSPAKDLFVQRSSWIVFAGLLLLGSIIYSDSFKAGFQYDDQRIIVQNDAVQSPFKITAIWNYDAARFLTNWTFALNNYLGRGDVFCFHIVNLLIHVLASFVCYLLLRLTFQTPGMQNSSLKPYCFSMAFFASVLFLCHPIQTQAVTYIVQRSASLAALFYLLTVYLIVRHRLSGRQIYYGMACLSALAAFFSKQNAYSLPVALLGYELFFFKTKKFSWQQTLFYYLPFFALVIFVNILCYHANSSAQGIDSLLNIRSEISQGQYLLTQFNVIRTYLRLLILPLHQNLDYDYPVARSLFELSTFSSFLLLSGVVYFGIRRIQKNRLMAFGIFWFFTSLSVESLTNIYDVIYEHRLYLPLFGFAAAVVALGYERIRNKKYLTVSLLVLLSIFSVMTYQRNRIWESELTLWQDVVKKSPDKGRSQFALGNAYMRSIEKMPADRKRKIELAVEHFQNAVRLKLPQLAEAYNSLAIAYTFMGDFEKAVENYRNALREKPNYETARRNLTLVENMQKQSPEEKQNFLAALKFQYGEKENKPAPQASYDKYRAESVTQAPSRSSSREKTDEYAALIQSGGAKLMASPVNPDGSMRPDTVFSLEKDLGDNRILLAMPVNADGSVRPDTTYEIKAR